MSKSRKKHATPKKSAGVGAGPSRTGTDAAKADSVMQFTISNLYMSHLLPSYSNLQAADILLALDKAGQAKSLCTSLFDFYFDKIQSDKTASKGIDRLDVFLATQSAEMLNRMGDASFQLKMNNLGFQGSVPEH